MQNTKNEKQNQQLNSSTCKTLKHLNPKKQKRKITSLKTENSNELPNKNKQPQKAKTQHSQTCQKVKKRIKKNARLKTKKQKRSKKNVY